MYIYIDGGFLNKNISLFKSNLIEFKKLKYCVVILSYLVYESYL